MSSYLIAQLEVRANENEDWQNVCLYTKKNGEFRRVDPYCASASGCGDLLLDSHFFDSAILRKRELPCDLCEETLEQVQFAVDGNYPMTWYSFSELECFEKALKSFAEPILKGCLKSVEDVDMEDDAYWQREMYEDYKERIELFCGFMDSLRNVLEEYDVFDTEFVRVICYTD